MNLVFFFFNSVAFFTEEWPSLNCLLIVYPCNSFFSCFVYLKQIVHLVYLFINIICSTVTTTTPPPGKELQEIKINHIDLLVYNTINRACHFIV